MKIKLIAPRKQSEDKIAISNNRILITETAPYQGSEHYTGWLVSGKHGAAEILGINPKTF